MVRASCIGLAVTLSLLCAAGVKAQSKASLLKAVDRQRPEAWQSALKIWKWAEPGYQEHLSSAELQSMLQRAGFRIVPGVSEMPTAFTAEFGAGQPVIGILGEFDALPGLSQQETPVRAAREPGGYGHGCGHHLFGVASAMACIALADQMQAGHLQGTVRYYGCPAEEGGSAKAFMVRDGLFDDCAAVLHWHPGGGNVAGDRSSLARIAVKFRFHGKAAHAAGAPEQGRSALDAVELTNHATQLLREHCPEGTRIHHVVTAGGFAPNIVPDFAEVYYYVRHPQASVVRGLYQRLKRCAEAGALATDTRLEVDYQGGIVQLLPNNTLGTFTLANLRELNQLDYDQQQRKFATRIQASLLKPFPLESVQDVVNEHGTVGMGSTDVGDVSWVVPTTGFTTACFVPGTPGHSWQAVACGGTSVGKQGMELAARVLAATAWDLYRQPETLQTARSELTARLGRQAYQSLMEPNQKPPLDYRLPPVK